MKRFFKGLQRTSVAVGENNDHPMRLASLLKKVCVVAAIACLGLAYIPPGYWLILPALLAMALFWVTQRRSGVWTASSLLLIYVLLAVVGIGLHLPVLLLAAGCTAALAAWDLNNFEQSLAQDQALDKHHLRSLAIAASLGLILPLVSASISIRIPFAGIVLLVLVAIGGLTYGLRFLTRKDP